jgi:hypothetical protein
MAYNSTINTATTYFSAINGIIEGMYWQDPTGKVDPNCLNSFLEMRNIRVTQIGLDAHKWATEQLHYAIQRWFKSNWNLVQDQDIILAFYRNINLAEYTAYAEHAPRVAALERWTNKEQMYLKIGDDESAIFCAIKRELIAQSIATGIPVKELEEDDQLVDDIRAKLDPRHGFLRHSRLEE